MSKLWLQPVALALFSVAAVRAAVLPGRYLTPAVPIEVSDVLFPAVGPVTAVLSPVATVGGDGRVSDTQLVSSGGSTWNGTLVGYEENSTGAAKDWKFSPAFDVSTLKPTQSVASITFVYHRMFAVPFDVEPAFSMNTAVAGIPGIFRPIQPARMEGTYSPVLI